MEIAVRAMPVPPEPAAPGGLPLRAQPLPFGEPGLGQRSQIGICRAGLRDEADPFAQNKDAAAAALASPSSGLNR